VLNLNNKTESTGITATSTAASLALIALLLFGLASCSHDARPNPKDTIVYMFDAMRQSDSISLAMNIDLASAARGMERELAPVVTDSNEAQSDPAALLLSSMVGEGNLRKRWLDDNQIVLGKTETTGDTALVEVSFIDKITRVQYYNKMRLVFRNDRWIVTDFRTL
jgi:hypothetical protein